MNVMLRAALAGAATGSRSQLAVAACALTDPVARRGPAGWIDKRLHHRAERVASVGAAAVELVADKLPKTPSRLEPGGFAPRLVLGAVTGAVVAGRHRGDQRLGALVGTAAAALTTFAGARARTALSGKLGQDLPGALAEDAVAIALAVAATR